MAQFKVERENLDPQDQEAMDSVNHLFNRVMQVFEGKNVTIIALTICAVTDVLEEMHPGALQGARDFLGKPETFRETL